MMVTALICFIIYGDVFETLDGIFNWFDWVIDPALYLLGGSLKVLAITLVHLSSFLSDVFHWIKYPLIVILRLAFSGEPAGCGLSCFLFEVLILGIIVYYMMHAGGLWVLFGWLVVVIGFVGAIFIAMIVYALNYDGKH